MRRPLLCVLACLLGPCLDHAPLHAAGGALEVSGLRWDGRENPLGLIQFEPRLAWVVSSTERGQRQTAYQVLVASDPGKLVPGKADVWDSQKVASSDSLNVRYGGPTPLARQRAYFTVRVWDKDDKPTAFARPGSWEMGLYDEEWEGKWIGRPAKASDVADRSVGYLRKTFVIPKAIKRARLYASAFGVYEMRVNGKRASDDVLAPGYTDYEKRVLFQGYDVTALLRPGKNVVAAIVGGGWCTAALGGRAGACGTEPPRVMAQLEVTLVDGTLIKVITDESWRSHAGPIVSSHLYDGETYDARLEMPGWDTPAFTGDDWAPVQPYDKKKERDLVADPGTPVKPGPAIKPVRVSSPRPGVSLFDLGQNIVGRARLTVSAPAGTTITLRYAEALMPDGSLYVDNLRAARATDRYTTRTGGRSAWEPLFTLHGFRYVEVSGAPGPLGPGALVGLPVHSVMPEAGALETSDPQLNQLLRNIDWSQRGAFLSVPARGPQRDERLGALLEAQVFAQTACLNRDVRLFFRKWIDDIRDAQRPNAAYTDVAPLVVPREGGAGAAMAGVLVPWAQYLCYADRTPIDAHFASMGRFLDHVRSENPDGVWRRGVGPVADPQEQGTKTDPALVGTALLAYASRALAQMARAAGSAMEGEAKKFDALAQSARAGFAREFLRPDGKLTSDTQTAYAVALALDVLPEAARAQAGAHLVAAIERAGRHLTTGVLGAAHILPALSAVGRDDVAYALLQQTTCPSWRCSLAEGATTVWERFDGYTRDKGFADAQANSFNHYAFGAVGAWMYDALGGIALDPRAPAGRHVIVRPRPGGGVTWARARYRSALGPIATSWRHDKGQFRLELTIPANTTATVILPFAGKVAEAGKPIAASSGVTVMRSDAKGTEMTIGSGRFDFTVAAP